MDLGSAVGSEAELQSDVGEDEVRWRNERVFIVKLLSNDKSTNA